MSSFAEITEAVSHIHKAHDIQVQPPSRSISSVLSCLVLYREDLPTLCWIQKGFWRQDTLLCVMETQKPLSQRRAQDREERGWLNLLTICDPGLCMMHNMIYHLYNNYLIYSTHLIYSTYFMLHLTQGAQDAEIQGASRHRETHRHRLASWHKTTVEKVSFKIIFFREKILNKSKTVQYYRPSLDESSSKEESVSSVNSSEEGAETKE